MGCTTRRSSEVVTDHDIPQPQKKQIVLCYGAHSTGTELKTTSTAGGDRVTEKMQLCN